LLRSVAVFQRITDRFWEPYATIYYAKIHSDNPAEPDLKISTGQSSKASAALWTQKYLDDKANEEIRKEQERLNVSFSDYAKGFWATDGLYAVGRRARLRTVSQGFLDNREAITKNHIVPYWGKYRLYGMDCEYPFEVHVKGELREATPLRLCLFFDPEQQGAKKKEIADFMYRNSESLQSHIRDQIPLSDEAIQEFSKYFTLIVDEETNMLLSFEEKDTVVKQQYVRSGFFACLCNNMDRDRYPLTAILDRYRMRDEQEKSFMFIKSTQNGRRLRTSTEPSTEGRVFIQFIALILNSHIHHIYSNSPTLEKMFPTRQHMYHELMSIRRIEHPKKAKIVTEFVGRQVDIFDCFGYEIPKGCRPKSRQKKIKEKCSKTVPEK
jgi:hypothetical protein